MELLIRVVDAELLEGVGRKVLEAKDVKEAEELGWVLPWVRARVDVIDEPGEGSGVEGLRHCMSVLTPLQPNV